MTEADEVLIVGAGPTGLLLAGDLAAAGVPVTVLERREHESNLSRAFAVHARTLEMLDARGVADQLLTTGEKLSHLSVLGRAQMDLSRLPTRFPFVLVTPQYHVEHLLAERAWALGAKLEAATLVTDVREQDGHAEVDVRTKAGTTSIRRAAYVVGADGVHSTVREKLGMPFPGEAVLRSVMLGDVRLAEPPEDVIFVNSNHAGFAFLAPFGDGFYRVIAWDRGRQVPDSEPVDFSELRRVTADVLGSDFGMHDPRWLSRFHNDERQVPQYRDGRFFLAGDAAHVHSPAGGQGMNTGLQDAANLSWKLAAVLKGWTDDSLLESYHAERYPVGKFVLRLSGSVLRFALISSDRLRTGIGEVAGVATRISPLTRRGGLAVSGLGISYPAGPHAHRLTGKRMPDVPLTGGRGRLYEILRGGTFVLLLGAGTAPPQLAGWSGRLEIVSRTREQPRFILVRPDGYIAWAADGADDLQTYADLRTALRRWCGPPVSLTTTA